MRVAIIEDDSKIMEGVSIAFETAWPGSQIVCAPNAVEGLDMVKNETQDVVILDVALQEGDSRGFDLCEEIRTFSEVPIIMVTARTREVDIVRGLELGPAGVTGTLFTVSGPNRIGRRPGDPYVVMPEPGVNRPVPRSGCRMPAAPCSGPGR